MNRRIWRPLFFAALTVCVALGAVLIARGVTEDKYYAGFPLWQKASEQWVNADVALSLSDASINAGTAQLVVRLENRSATNEASFGLSHDVEYSHAGKWYTVYR